jgi:hypothetical protein
MWLQMGKPHRAGLGGDFMMNFYHELMTDDTWSPPAPVWTSENIPGFGAVLRANFNTDRETYMVYHQGNVSTAHYDYDQGSFEMWGKGRPLSLDWGYHGQAPSWQHNMMEIGTAGTVVNFAGTPSADYLQGQQDGGWGRQIVLVKDKDPLGPNYFVLRETTTGTGAAGWWLWINTRKDAAVPPAASPIGAGPDSVPLAATGPGKPIEIVGDQVHAVGEQDVDLDVWFGPPSADRLKNLEVKELTISVPAGLPNGDWTGWDDSQATQQGLHLQQPLGQPLVSVLYPRLRTEAPAQFTALADGKVTKVVTPRGTDYVFLGTEPFTFQDGPVTFSGTVGVIQVRGTQVTCTLNAAGDVTYGKAHLVAQKAQSQQFDTY